MSSDIDIVERLRLYAAAEVIHAPLNGGGFDVARDAADEIERLRALITEWATALEALRVATDDWREGWDKAYDRWAAAETALTREVRRG